MELLTKTKAVKLRSHLDKYLVADDDKETVRQSRNGRIRKAVWTVEAVPNRPNLIRFKSCHDKYLTACETPFLLGMTGEKVIQTNPFHLVDWQINWEPIRDGVQVKLRSWCGKLLRANGGTPPWRNSVTHDEPHTSATKGWVLWDVLPVDDPEALPLDGAADSPYSTKDSLKSIGSEPGSPLSMASLKSLGLSFTSSMSPRLASKLQRSSLSRSETSAMEFFHRAKAVRLRSHHDKYLMADEDEESVIQDKNASAKSARWTVEPVPGSDSAIRLKSCYGKYLTASDERFLLGATGRKVFQSKPSRLDSCADWEPIKDGSRVMLKTRDGYLRANGGPPPYKNSVTHGVPHRTSTQEWILWHVDMVEILVEENMAPGTPPWQSPPATHSYPTSPSSVSVRSEHITRQESSDSFQSTPKKSDGRTVYYHVAEEDGSVQDDDTVGYPLSFEGNSLQQLIERLREDTGLDDIIVCTHNPVNGKLCPLRLQLPPNNADMHVVLVPSTSGLAREFAREGVMA